MESIKLQSIESLVSRAVSGRLLPGTELINGIQKMCFDNDLKYGVVICGIGSLTKAKLIYAIPDEQRKTGIKYSNTVTINGPLELLSCQGMIGYSHDGEFSIHLHATISDSDMKLYGGHFVEGCIILATVEIAILELTDAELLRDFDEETGFSLFKFFPKK